MKSKLNLSAAVVTLAMLGAGAPAFAQDAAAPAAASGADQDRAVGDIIVTASRREERLNSVPIAVQALSTKALQQLNVQNFEKLIEFLPNVRVATHGPGTSSIFIRGLSTDAPGLQILGTAGAQPTVALYVNDAPASLVGRNLDIYAADLQRVEVLAGPQGTLFGASSMGGAVRYITNKPNLSEFHAGFNGHYSFTKGGKDSEGGDGYINLPIIKDRLAARLVLYSDRQGGYIDNVPGTFQLPFDAHIGQAGQIPTGNPLLVTRALQACQAFGTVVNGIPTCNGSEYRAPVRQTINNDRFVEDNYNDATYYGGRLAVTFKINEEWSIDAMHLRQRLNTDGAFDYEPAVGDLKVTQFNPNRLRDSFEETTWTVNGRLAFLNLIYTGSYLHHNAVQTADYAGYSNIGLYLPYYECDRGVYYTAAYNGNIGNTCYTPNKSYRVRNETNRFTHEFRVTTPAEERIRGTFGVFYDVNRLTDNTDWSYLQPAAGFINPRRPNPNLGLTPNNPNVRPLQVGFFNDTQRRDRQVAVYGEASFDVIPKKLIVTGGLRYYNEEASLNGSSNTSFPLFASNVAPGCAIYPGGRGVYDPATGTYSPGPNPPQYYGCSANLNVLLRGVSPATYSGVLFKGNLTYKFGDSLAYFTYSEGYRPGGFNRRPCRVPSTICPTFADFARLAVYVPDQVKNYEIGTKLALFDHTLQFNAAAYLIEWSNVQLTVFDQNISNQTFTTNLVDARIKGIEGDFTWRPIRELTINGAFSFNDSELTKYRRNTTVLLPLGSPLALSPTFQGNLRVRYEKEVAPNTHAYIQTAYHHVSSSISSDIANVDIRYQSFNPTLGYAASTPVLYNGVLVRPGDVIKPLPGSFRQGAYDTFSTSVGVTKDNWGIEVYGENLTDTRPNLYTSGNDGELRTTTSRPRTIGVRVSYNF